MSLSSLAKVLQEASDYNAELFGENDRAAAILAAANFEQWLLTKLSMRFVPLGKPMRKRIFENYGPLSTFSSKIDIAFAVGLYDKNTWNGLNTVKKIRNRFAHSSKPINFDDGQLSSLCQKLCIIDASKSSNLRSRYLTYLIEVRQQIERQNATPFLARALLGET